MKMSEARKIIDELPTFRVHFEERDGCILRTDYVPECDEAPFDTESEAWDFASEMAREFPSKYVNFFVVDSCARPVEGYRPKTLRGHFPS